MKFNLKEIKSDFPILNQKINGNSLIYFDNAATTQKPRNVINKITEYYTKTNSNVHRGAHSLSYLATKEMEDSRKEIQNFINANKKTYKLKHNSRVFNKNNEGGLNQSINHYSASVGLFLSDSPVLANLREWA